MTKNTPKVAAAMQHLDENMVLNAAREPKRRRSPWAAVAACLAVVILAAAVVPGFTGSGAVETVVALDVNPSMEINVDRNEKVISVIPLNDDAQIVVGDMDLKKVGLDVAVNALVGSMLKNGYLTIDRNSILVSVQSNDAAKGEALQQKLSTEVAKLLEGSNLQASVLSQSFTKPETTDTAAAVSPAKDALVKKIVALNMADAHGVPYTYEALAPLSIHELKQLVESRALTVENVTSTGTASTTGYIGKDAALNAALAHAGITAADATLTEWELDYERGQMVYSIDFYAGSTEYDYDVNAVTGAIVAFEKEVADRDDWNDTWDDDWDDRPVTSISPAAGNILDRDTLVNKALERAGLSRSDVRDLDYELDFENGRQVCEVSFDSGNMDYEVKLDPASGEVLFYESERDD